MKRLFKWIQENKEWVFSGVGNKPLDALIVLLVGSLGLVVFRKTISIKINHTFQVLWNHFTRQVSIPSGFLYLLVLFGVVVLLALKLIKTLFQDKIPKSYKEDSFFEIIWRWKWKKNEPVDIDCFCPQCETRLELSCNQWGEPTLRCELCNQCFKLYSKSPDAVNQIKRYIKTEETKNSYNRLAKVCEEKGRIDKKAMTYLEKALSVTPEDEHARTYLALIYSDLARKYSREDKKKLSIEYLQKTFLLGETTIIEDIKAEAKKEDSDFNNIRKSPKFQQLINS